jgi:protein gp37
MVAGTGIEWTEVTWNPTTGCDRISAGCDNCYALALARRLKAMGQALPSNCPSKMIRSGLLEPV